MNTLTQTDIEGLRASIGRVRSMRQTIDATSLERFDAACGAEASPLAHWSYFHDIVPGRLLGADGHPQRGDFLPAIDLLPLRMFAGASIDFGAPLTVGMPATLTQRIVDLQHKQGASGDLIFVNLQREIVQADTMRVSERQTLVYRTASPAVDATAPAPRAAEPASAFTGPAERWLPGPVDLFRFSAATFNGHRIHYDRPYATEIERYPDLVVHGPFIAAQLAALAARGGALARFEFQARAPCFVDRPIRLGETAPSMWAAIRDDDILSMTAKATYR